MKISQTGRLWSLLAVSVGLGGVAAWSIDKHLVNQTHEIKRHEIGHEVMRLVAAHRLESGTVIQLTDLAARAMPERWADPDSIDTADAVRIVGMQTTVSLAAGQSILNVHVIPRPDAALATKLTAGKRAVTIPVDQINSLSGMLNPGDSIDLFVSFDHQGRRMTAPLLSEVQVLATGRQIVSGDDRAGTNAPEYTTLTLETSPEDAVKLVAARQSGTITAVLNHARSDLDPVRQVRRNPRTGGHLAGLLGMELPPEPNPIPVIYGDRLLERDSSVAGSSVPLDLSMAEGQASR